jgi:hypothetical protein
MTATLDHVLPSILSRPAVDSERSAYSTLTTLRVSPIFDAKRAASLVMFLHSNGVDEVGFAPQTNGCFQFEVPIPFEELLAAFLDSGEFQPRAVRSFASGRLEITLPS